MSRTLATPLQFKGNLLVFPYIFDIFFFSHLLYWFFSVTGITLFKVVSPFVTKILSNWFQQSYLVRVPLNSFNQFLSFVIYRFHKEGLCFSVIPSLSVTVRHHDEYLEIQRMRQSPNLPRRDDSFQNGSCAALTCTSITFHTVVRIPIRYNHWDELKLVCLALVSDFAPISCKQIQSDKWEPRWTRIGMKVVSCKHSLTEKEEDAFFFQQKPTTRLHESIGQFKNKRARWYFLR